MTYSQLIAEVTNQQQTLTAIIEQTERAAYFYIWPTEPFRSRFAVRGGMVSGTAAGGDPRLEPLPE